MSSSFEVSDTVNPFIVFGALLLGVIIVIEKNGIKTLQSDIKNTYLVLFAVFVTIFSIVVFRTESKTDKQRRLKEATRKALAAFFIAYLRRLDLIFAPFFIILSLDYFLSGWV